MPPREHWPDDEPQRWSSSEFASSEECEAWHKAEAASRYAAIVDLVQEGKVVAVKPRTISPLARGELGLLPPLPQSEMGTRWITPCEPNIIRWKMGWTDPELLALSYFLRRIHNNQWVSALEIEEFFHPFDPNMRGKYPGHGRPGPHASNRRPPSRDTPTAKRAYQRFSFERILSLMWCDQPTQDGSDPKCHGQRFAVAKHASELGGIYLLALGDERGKVRGLVRNEHGAGRPFVGGTKDASVSGGYLPGDAPSLTEAWKRDFERVWDTNHPLTRSAYDRQQIVLQCLLLGGTPQDVDSVCTDRMVAPGPAYFASGRGRQR